MVAIVNSTYKSSTAMDADHYATEVNIAVEEMRREPFYLAQKKPPDVRLDEAKKLVLAGRVQGSSDGQLWQVHGREQTYYLRGTEPCTCPQGQKGRSAHCKHWVAVQLYKNVQLRLGGTAQPALALGPSTPEEHLAQVPVDALGWPLEPVLLTAEDIERIDDSPVTHEEADMSDEMLEMALESRQGEIVEPEPSQGPGTPSVVVEPSATSTQALVPVQPLLPTSTAQALEASLQEWSQQRAVVRRFIRQEMKEGVDFYTLRIGGRETKPTLSKAGAEKFLALFQLHAVFTQDVATWEMLGKPTDVLCYQCTLLTRTGEVIGEGHGVRQVGKDRDLNMSVKMGIKSSLLDAVLRVGSLSEVFTQDLDDMADASPAQERAPASPSAKPLSPKQQIVRLLQQLGIKATTQQEYAAAVQEYAGWPLTEANYPRIISALEATLAQRAA